MRKSSVGEVQKPGRRALADWAVSRLYSMIFSGELPPGTPLGEIETTTLLGVSRSPVRDALRQLEESGLIEIVPSNGRRIVRRFDSDDIYELYSIRVALERMAAAHAASRITREELTNLGELLASMRKASTTTRSSEWRDLEADFAFHEVICIASGLERLHRILSALWHQTRALLRHVHEAGIFPTTADQANSIAEDHAPILEALLAHDGLAAEEAMSRHLLVRRDQLIEAVRAHGGMTRSDGGASAEHLVSLVGGRAGSRGAI